jgi:hypothetical protein
MFFSFIILSVAVVSSPAPLSINANFFGLFGATIDTKGCISVSDRHHNGIFIEWLDGCDACASFSDCSSNFNCVYNVCIQHGTSNPNPSEM